MVALVTAIFLTSTRNGLDEAGESSLGLASAGGGLGAWPTRGTVRHAGRAGAEMKDEG